MSMVSMNKMYAGQVGTIVSIKASGQLRRRLRDLGLVTGRPLRMQSKAPLLDPITIRIMGFTLALRKNEASHILVEVR